MLCVCVCVCVCYILGLFHILIDRCFTPTTIDIYTVDTVPPVHIVWHHEAIAKSTTQDGGMAETYICGRKLRLVHLYRSVDVST